jgi:transcriptional regulator with XRE-family HTH domain
MSALGDKLRRLRKAKGLTQGELAEKVGVDIKTIVRYETGKNSPKVETLELITKELGAKIVVIPEKELGGKDESHI